MESLINAVQFNNYLGFVLVSSRLILSTGYKKDIEQIKVSLSHTPAILVCLFFFVFLFSPTLSFLHFCLFLD